MPGQHGYTVAAASAAAVAAAAASASSARSTTHTHNGCTRKKTHTRTHSSELPYGAAKCKKLGKSQKKKSRKTEDSGQTKVFDSRKKAIETFKLQAVHPFVTQQSCAQKKCGQHKKCKGKRIDFHTENSHTDFHQSGKNKCAWSFWRLFSQPLWFPANFFHTVRSGQLLAFFGPPLPL